MFFVWKPCIALHVKRLAMALVVLPLVALIGACGNDDSKTPDPGAASSTSNDSGNGNAAVLSANPAAVLPSSAAVTIQSPALPASSADPALSAAASAPLATPVIHSVD
ncbi:hypothetical protein [Burkholderia sp. WSM2232]|uniref:hypothetical protein n=1 Tax=Burkholderia sp. WSM2232 TaxID=944436 RepID=UPI00041D7B1A|nr:hypothetical protein [Burkholderia sp. WSM2232]